MRAWEIGLAFQTDKRPGEYGSLARAAEEYGADVVTVYHDLTHQPSLGALLEMARETSRVRLGPACLNPFTTHPYEIAGQIALVDLVSGGRAYLGLARGSWLEVIGVDQPRPTATLTEAAAFVAALLAGDVRGMYGDVFQLAPGVRLAYERQRPRVPLLIGGWGPETLALAGRIADEAKIGGTANPAFVPIARDRVRVGAAEAGRSMDDVGLVVGAVSVVDEDGAIARARARFELALYLPVVADLDPTADTPVDLVDRVKDRLSVGDRKGAGDAIPEEVLDRFALSGTPDRVAAQAAALIDAGADRVEFGTPHGVTPFAGVDLIGNSVIPLVRSYVSR